MSSDQHQITTQEITITPEAAKEIQRIRLENQIPESHALRMGIKSGGCCGLSYLLAFDEKPEENDKVFLSEGVTIYVDTESLMHLSGTKLMLIDGPNGKGFKFDNPNDTKSCDCEDGCCD